MNELLTNAQINGVIESAKLAWKHSSKPHAIHRDEFLHLFQCYITKGGVVENVCPLCLGSGKKESFDDVDENDTHQARAVASRPECSCSPIGGTP